MRFAHALFTRPDWYDRNPITRINGYLAGGVAPHGTTQRWSYTVPAGKKTLVQVAASNISRTTVAAPAAFARAILQLTPSGGAATELISAINEGNAIGNNQVASNMGTMVLLPGDAITGLTADGSTGGSHAYLVSMEGLEFDA